jgi:hypothetical protein
VLDLILGFALVIASVGGICDSGELRTGRTATAARSASACRTTGTVRLAILRRLGAIRNRSCSSWVSCSSCRSDRSSRSDSCGIGRGRCQSDSRNTTILLVNITVSYHEKSIRFSLPKRTGCRYCQLQVTIWSGEYSPTGTAATTAAMATAEVKKRFIDILLNIIFFIKKKNPPVRRLVV